MMDTEPLTGENLFIEAVTHVRAYGLVFASDVRLDHFDAVDRCGAWDVRIRKGTLKNRGYVPPPTIRVESLPGTFVVKGAKSATFLVTGGNSITVDPLPSGNPSAIRQILLGWVFAGLFHQRGMPALHGSAIGRGDGCFVICAPSMGGKSTLTASFLNKGFSFLDDNIAVTAFENGEVFVVPGSPELRLWSDALDLAAFDTMNLGRIKPGIDKFSLIARGRFNTRKARLRTVFMLKRGASSTVAFEEVKGADRFRALLAQVFCVDFIGETGFTPLLFRQIHNLARHVPVVDILMPEERPEPDALRDLICAYLGM